ncbi:hypothetical protein LJB88_01580 [Erysipelotrichaceae bacterium OttesenSCG-928-M19]|nr:hypothetical protein [Erysipelotrichaceae bacterium OttesenSCG-928-M19]
MEWLFLIMAGLLEIIWAYTLTLSHSFTVLPYSLLTIFLVILCFYFLEKGIAKLGIGISYATFTAFGTIGTYFIAIYLEQVTINIFSIIAIVVLIGGIVGLKTIQKKGNDQ